MKLLKQAQMLVLTALVTSVCPVPAAEPLAPDVCKAAVAMDSVAAADTCTTTDKNKPSRNIIQKVIDYFGQTNDEKPDKKFDVSVIGGPSYSEATSLEIAALVSGLYRTRHDSLTPRSDISIYGQGSITGFYNFGIKGTHIFPSDKIRIVYDANFCHFPLKFWGIGYDNGINKENESDYTLLESAMTVQCLWKLPHDIFLGPTFNFNYQKATKVERPELWQGEDMRQFSYGFGVVLSIDKRDLPTNASKGYYIGFHQQFFPGFMGNDYVFSMTEVSAMYYRSFWKSGTMAFRLHGAAAYGNPSWGMLPTLDNGNAVRGYYEGRYRDKNEADVIVELRQHVWRRNGIVVWAGVGTVFNRMRDISWHTLLPTYGVGYRWEFKKKVNVRLDIGFGKHSKSIHVGINEAF